MTSALLSWRRTIMVLAVGFLLVAFTNGFDQHQIQPSMEVPQGSKQTHHYSESHRKLLDGVAAAARMKPNGFSRNMCTKRDIVVSQGATEPLPSGIPTFTVEIMNLCTTCKISNIHLTCGSFSSASFINPRVFKRVGYNDCIVNNGSTLITGHPVSFKYATTYKYPLSVSHVNVTC